VEFYAVADGNHDFDFVEEGGVVVRGLLLGLGGEMARGEREEN
jgi:hypothetical protein